MATSCIGVNCNTSLTSSITQSIGDTFTSAVNVFLTAQCLLSGNSLNECLLGERWPVDSSNDNDMTFDFIIVGAGSAGSVLANRLTEVSCWNVLLIEAGEDPPFTSQVPGIAPFVLDSPADWRYTSERELTCKGMVNERCQIPRGKALGGSSSINFMLYVRGNSRDYDNIAAAGNTGWSYQEILPYFIKSENLSQPEVQNDPILRQYHGYDGPLNVVPYSDYGTQPIVEPLVRAYEQIGQQSTVDINGPSQAGVVRAQSTTYQGRRESTARAFLAPISRRPNLRVWKNALVSKVLFNGTTATGVQVILSNGTEVQVSATREVIISAGSINTPQLLLLSGIGPRVHLNDFNINVVADLPVGENLHDHPFLPLMFGFNNGWPPESWTSNAIEYITNGSGIFAQNAALEVLSFFNTLNETEQQPDLQMNHLSFDRSSDLATYEIFTTLRYNEQTKNSIANFNRQMPILLVALTLLNPKSLGRVRLSSNDPRVYPRIYQNFLSDSRDLETFLRGVDIAYRLLNTESFRALGGHILPLDIPRCNNETFQSRAYWTCFAYNFVMSIYHPLGTAKMGPRDDPTTVVDPNLRVHNVQRLRVVDGSVIPSQISANTNAPIIMIAEKAADLIKSDYQTEASC